jgi:hypothetical protein
MKRAAVLIGIFLAWVCVFRIMHANKTAQKFEAWVIEQQGLPGV